MATKYFRYATDDGGIVHLCMNDHEEFANLTDFSIFQSGDDVNVVITELTENEYLASITSLQTRTEDEI